MPSSSPAASGITRRPEQLLGHGAVVEGLDDAADVLALLVALAEDEHEIAVLGIGQGARDGAPAVVLDERLARRARAPSRI